MVRPEEVEEVRDALAAVAHPLNRRVSEANDALARALVDTGDPARAVGPLRDALGALEARLGTQSVAVALECVKLAGVLHAAGDTEGARAAANRGAETLRLHYSALPRHAELQRLQRA